MTIESFAQQPLQTVPKAYPYAQYSDDPNVAAFFTAYTQIAQGYLQWYNDTPLGLYTSSNIVGSLLDWTAAGIYGVVRPVISTLTRRTRGGFGSRFFGGSPYGVFQVKSSGTAQVANDDYYKRVLTWTLYKGDGDNVDIAWLKKRIARFLYGANGADVDVGMANYISIMPMMMVPDAGYGRRAYGKKPAYGKMFMRQVMSIRLYITIPNIPAAQVFIDFVNEGILPMPIQITWVINRAFVLGQSTLNNATIT